METTADDNFFIEEPQKLGNNFFNKDKSIQIVELLAPKHNEVNNKRVQPILSQLLPIKKPEYKLNSVEHIIQLLGRVKDMLDYREKEAVDWLSAILDAHFVELATTDEAADIIDQISAHIDFQCDFLRETENTKCLLKPIMKQLDNENGKASRPAPLLNSHLLRHKRLYHIIDHIEF